MTGYRPIGLWFFVFQRVIFLTTLEERVYFSSLGSVRLTAKMDDIPDAR